MRVLCDVHIPYRLISRLRDMGVDATHVNRILNGSETTDAAITDFVDAHGMLLITKDGDFRDSHFLNGKPARLLRITLGNLSNTELTTLIEAHWSIIAEIAGQERCYIELSRHGIVRFPNN
jgi:predicted nuclease of predicted toxin-antitoxin system